MSHLKLRQRKRLLAPVTQVASLNLRRGWPRTRIQTSYHPRNRKLAQELNLVTANRPVKFGETLFPGTLLAHESVPEQPPSDVPLNPVHHDAWQISRIISSKCSRCMRLSTLKYGLQSLGLSKGCVHTRNDSGIEIVVVKRIWCSLTPNSTRAVSGSTSFMTLSYIKIAPVINLGLLVAICSSAGGRARFSNGKSASSVIRSGTGIIDVSP